ncbi:hypothetical protein DW745_09265 [Ruminococcus sp. AM28-29LB]|nr:hypothetical protein DW745_09265 [Ruminococcus sp. AM28-29LB]
MISDPKKNINWIKTNIKGHDYFNFVHSKDISYENYVDELPKSAFESIIDFLDTVPYFLGKKL